MRPKEVSMRPPSVFVRPLLPEEGQRLKGLSRRAKHFSTRQRAQILLASATEMSPPEIARALMSDESHVRKVIHDFNERGFDSLRPNFRGGRPRRLTDDEHQTIVACAGARPAQEGVPLTRWSLPRLSRHLKGRGISVSPSQLGRILAKAGLSFQRTRSWLASPDPDYEAKAARVLALYREKPQDGVVISFDEGGPYGLRPTHGRGWAPRKRPTRLRARYNRRSGVRYLFGAYDVHADYLRARLRPGKNAREILTFMKTIRLAYPRRVRIYWIQDNLSCHWTPAIREWAEANNVELVPPPPHASYQNRNACHPGAIGEFVWKNADYLDWDSFGLATAAHIRYRNDPAERDERLIKAERRRLIAA
jgi:transposase